MLGAFVEFGLREVLSKLDVDVSFRSDRSTVQAKCRQCGQVWCFPLADLDVTSWAGVVMVEAYPHARSCNGSQVIDGR